MILADGQRDGESGPIRIARILGRPNVGGPARTVLHLARRLDARGFETLVITGAPDRSEGDFFADATDVRIERVPEMRRLPSLSDFAARRRIADLLREFRPDVVHTHAAKAGALGRRAALSLERRPAIVHTFHGHSLAGYFPRPVGALFARIERALARDSDALIAVSERTRRELTHAHGVAGAARFAVIENGIDLAPFQSLEPADERRAAARAALGVRDPEARIVLVPARLAAVKGHDLLFAALARWPRSGPPIEVHLAGDGPLRAALEARAPRKKDGVLVVFHGMRKDLPAVLPGADVVVLPSRSEGMSLALIEAMAAGRPIVATAVGGTPDLVETSVTGLLVPRDPVELLIAIRRLLVDPAAAARLGAAARRRALERHSIERVVLEHERLYRELLARGRGALEAQPMLRR